MNELNKFQFISLFLSTMLVLKMDSVFANKNFNITPENGQILPWTVTNGQVVSAFYTITNQTNSPRNGYSIQGKPTTVSQNSNNLNNCPNPINLESGANCTLQLDITGKAISNFALCKGASCTSASVPLNTAITSNLFAYVTDFSNNLWQCPIDATGNINSNTCIVASSSFTTTSSVTLAQFSGTTYAYIADTSTKIWQCPMNTAGGVTGGVCTTLAPNFTTTQAVTFGLFSGITYAYVTDGSSSVWKCPMNATGEIANDVCTALTNSTASFNSTSTLTFSTFSGITYAYVSDSSSNLWQCPMNTTGSFSSGCIQLTNNFSNTLTTTFATFSNITYAYITDNTSHVSQCPMNAAGGFSGGCTQLTNSTAPGFNTPNDLIFSTLSGKTYAYVTDFSSQVWQCLMNATGGFSGGCTLLINSTAPGFHDTTSIVLQGFN